MATKPKTVNERTSMRPLCGARRRDSLAMREIGTRTVLPAATAPNGPGQLMSTCSTAMTSAMALARTVPMANHCSRSRS